MGDSHPTVTPSRRGFLVLAAGAASALAAAGCEDAPPSEHGEFQATPTPYPEIVDAGSALVRASAQETALIAFYAATIPVLEKAGASGDAAAQVLLAVARQAQAHHQAHRARLDAARAPFGTGTATPAPTEPAPRTVADAGRAIASVEQKAVSSYHALVAGLDSAGLAQLCTSILADDSAHAAAALLASGKPPIASPFVGSSS